MSGNSNEIKTIGANEPILLDNPNEILLIRKGYVDVFAVLLNKDNSWGKKYYLFQVPASSAIFGIEPTEFSFRLLGIASNNTQIQKYPVSILLPDLQQDTSKQARVAVDHLYLLEDWIRLLIKAIIPKKSFAKNPAYLKPEENNLSAGQSITSLDYRLYWCKVETGEVTTNCYSESCLSSEDDFFPFSAPMFLYAKKDSRLKFISSADWLTKHYSPQGLINFYKKAFHCIAKKIELIEQEITHDIDEKKHINALVHRQPLQALKSLFLAKKTSKTYAAPTPLLQAIQKLSELQDFTINTSNIAVENQVAEGPIALQNLTAEIGIKIRRVSLRGDWWQNISTPLLVFTEDNDIGILEPGSKKLKLHYIKEEKTVFVNKAVALTIKPDAFVFYAPNQKPKLQWKDIVKIGFWGNAGDILRVLAMTFAMAILGALTPVITGIVFNQVIPENDLSLHFQVISLLVIALLISAAFAVAQIANKLRLKVKIAHTFQTLVWDRILRFPIGFFKQFTIGDLAYRLSSVDGFFRNIVGSSIRVMTSIIFTIVSIALLFYYQPLLAVVATAIGFLSVATQIVLSYLISSHQEKIYSFAAETNNLSKQFFSNIAKIRNNVSEERAYAKWIDTFTSNVKHSISINRLQSIGTIFSTSLNVFASLVFFNIIIAREQSIAAGDVIAFLAAFAMLTISLNYINESIQQLLTSYRTYKYISPILETSPEDIALKESPSALQGDIEVKNLSFKYQNDLPLILKNVSMHIHPGEFVAIVGPSGCGKSTLLRLLLNFEQATSGDILYDGLKISDIDIRVLRRQFGVVLQNSALATASIYENISSTDRSVTMADAWEASKFSAIDEFIRSLPMQMQTLIMEGGATFSGGQRQQLMLARAIARKAPILFLDEASSALDNNTQELVSRNLKKMDNTRIVVAHRLSTIVGADTIYVMENGTIVQKGNYSHLINDEHGLFARLAKRQLL